jgi:ParB family transcriptional regulator, chromosome partitioning protein
VSSVRRIGLPQAHRMRHDPHFVDQLARPTGAPIGRMVGVEEIEANPHQPRQNLGDLSELVASVREKGILEPLLVRALGPARFQIIAGERRFRAAVEAGLDEVPCVIREASESELMELALIENLQRRDLTAFEEADGLRALAETHGYTHEMMAERLGKGRTSITETLSLASMPEEVRQICRLADISSKSLLLQVIRQSDTQKMLSFVERLQKEGRTREDARRISGERKKAPRGRPRNFIFKFQPREKSYSLNLQFRKTEVPREEIIRTLERILSELRSQES